MHGGHSPIAALEAEVYPDGYAVTIQNLMPYDINATIIKTHYG